MVPWKHALRPGQVLKLEVVVVALVVVVEGEGCIEGEVTQLSVDRLT